MSDYSTATAAELAQSILDQTRNPAECWGRSQAVIEALAAERDRLHALTDELVRVLDEAVALIEILDTDPCTVTRQIHDHGQRTLEAARRLNHKKLQS